MVGLLNDTIFPAPWAYNVSASSTVSSGGGADLKDRIGAVKERRVKEVGGGPLLGVDGADARAIQ